MEKFDWVVWVGPLRTSVSQSCWLGCTDTPHPGQPARLSCSIPQPQAARKKELERVHHAPEPELKPPATFGRDAGASPPPLIKFTICTSSMTAQTEIA